jgi:hypothetical protein
MPAARFLASALACLVLGLGWEATTSAAEPAGAAALEAASANRLRLMPREERLALFAKLQEFDALSSAEKAAIRALNARIMQLPADEQANYWSVLRSYHHWVQGLSEEQRNQLNSVPLNERMKVVTRLRSEERATSRPGYLPLFVQALDFSTMTPLEMAHRIKAWLELTPEQRGEIEQIEGAAEQQRRLAELAQHVKMPSPGRITRAEEEAILAKIEASPQWKNSPLLGPLKKGDPAKQEKARRRIAASYYFLEKPPPAVDPTRLMQFEAALPPPYRGQFDHLPPEEARRRLTILYRLIYPVPAEMPEVPKAAIPQRATATSAPAAGAGTTPRPVPPPPRPGTGTNPF